MIYLVYSTIGKDRLFHGTFETEGDAIEAAMGWTMGAHHDTVYVKQFGVGTIWHGKRAPDDGYLVPPKLVVVKGAESPPLAVGGRRAADAPGDVGTG